LDALVYDLPFTSGAFDICEQSKQTQEFVFCCCNDRYSCRTKLFIFLYKGKV